MGDTDPANNYYFDILQPPVQTDDTNATSTLYMSKWNFSSSRKVLLFDERAVPPGMLYTQIWDPSTAHMYTLSLDLTGAP
jgi:hypothetical protein